MVSPLRPFDRNLLRLVLVTDGRGEIGRLESIVTAAVAGGVRCVQLREPQWPARLLFTACERLAPTLANAGGILLVNDRLDVAMSGCCHGAQLGHRSLPPEVARGIAGPNVVLGFSAHDASELDLAVAAGCDFALLSPVWPTTSKPGTPHLGPVRAGQMTSRARLPVVWLGGVDTRRLEFLRELPVLSRPCGVAVRSAIMDALDPAAAAAALVVALGQPVGQGTSDGAG